MFKKYFSIGLLCELIFTSSFATSIDIECKYHTVAADNTYKQIAANPELISSKFLSACLSPEWFTQISPFYFNDKKLIYSIDVEREEVTSSISSIPFAYPVFNTIYPDAILLKVSLDEKISMGIEWRLFINRVNGKLNGSVFAADDSWEPIFQKNKLMYSISGSCKPIKRLF